MAYDFPSYISYRIKKDMFHYDYKVDGEDSEVAQDALYKF